MNTLSTTLSATFERFIHSKRSSSLILIFCTLLAITMSNTSGGEAYQAFWQTQLGGLSIEHWVNDGLMAIFFLMIGLELERELYVGELAHIKNALLPMFAAVGGVIVPAFIHFSLNEGTSAHMGIAIPMATDIAFALGILALLGNRIPANLKVFLVALAVIDDLLAVIVIALFYTNHLVGEYFIGAILVFIVLVLMNVKFKIMALTPYLIGGVLLWFLTLKSGIHATVAGVALAFAIPFSALSEDKTSPSHRLENFLHFPSAFIILPIFALANTGITLSTDWAEQLMSLNSLGIMLGLVVGKPLGIMLACAVAIMLRVCLLPQGVQWQHIFGAALIAGIGFTMSIFITQLAFTQEPDLINSSKMAVFTASVIAGSLGLLWLTLTTKKSTIIS